MLITKGSREDAIHALINMWLKDPKMYCGWCGQDFLPPPQGEMWTKCCEQPFIGKNYDIMAQFLKELKNIRESRKNKFASTDNKTSRWKLSFPPGLLDFLKVSFYGLYGEELLTKEYGTTWFAKKFRQFTVPEEV